MLTTLFTFIQEKPQYGMGGTAGGLFIGASPTIFNISVGDVIPWLQLIAFLVTIVAGILTAWYTGRKIKQSKKK